jgi:hypothetical protein
MGMHASACVVYALDLGTIANPFRQRLYDAAEKCSGVELWTLENNGRVIVFARESHRGLISGCEVVEEVLDVEALPRGKRSAPLKPWRATLAAFCQSNGVVRQEPRWLIVSDVS